MNAIARLLVLLTAVAASPLSADLIHRYSFTTDANDSVGTAHGLAVQRSDQTGPLGSPVLFEGGQAVLDGEGAYIDLPNGIVSSLSAVTIEAWVTWRGGAAWQRIFDFGTSTSGEDTNGAGVIGTGEDYMFMTPNGAGSGRLRFAITDAAGAAERPILNDPDIFPFDQEIHVAVAYGSGLARLFVNGVEVASGAAEVPLSALRDINNWLGRSNWPDPMFNGAFNEFRVHNNLLGVPELKAAAMAGPDAVSYDPGTVSSLQITVENSMIVGQSQLPLLAGVFSLVGEVALGTGDVTLSSSAASIVRVGPGGTLIAAGIGNANITARRGTVSAVTTISVAPPNPATLQHRYSFSDEPGSSVIADSVGDADGQIIASVDPAPAPTLGAGQIAFPGGVYQTAGYVDLPNGIISSMTNVTVEVWTTWNGPANSNWQRIFDFGESQKGEDAQAGGNGLGYLFLTPRAGAGGNPLRFAARPTGTATENPILNGAGALPIGQEVHLVVIYAPEFRASRMYLNGILVASGSAPFALSLLNDVNNWLGASQWNDPPLNGRINEFRIYEGVLTDLEIALSRRAGPDALATAPGAFKSLALSPVTLFIGNPTATQAQLLATFENIENVNIAGVPGTTLTSGDPTIFTVNPTGGLVPRAVGSANLTGTYSGKTVTAGVTVAGPTALRLDLPSTLAAGGPPTVANLLANFPGFTDVNVSGFAGVTRSSSDPAIATIAANGTVLARNPGTTTITSSYGGLTNEARLTVAIATGFVRGKLIHRYSFGEAPNTTTLDDSVGTADGEVIGLVEGSVNNNFNGAGQLALAGGAWNANPLGSYVNLPNGLLSGLGSVTLEGWVTWRGGGNFQRFFDFGMSSGAPNDTGGFDEDVVANPGRSYMFLSPETGSPRFAIKQGTGPETPSLTSSRTITQNVRTHYALVYDQPNGVVRLYLNGERTGTAAATLPLSVVDDRNNWLGRSNWQDPLLNGLYDEFRIYDGALLDADVLASFQAGPDTLASTAEAHPADANSNFTLTIGEVVAYAAAWKRGDTWPSGPSPIPVSYVVRAGFLWKAGETYKQDTSSGAAPLWWIPAGQ